MSLQMIIDTGTRNLHGNEYQCKGCHT